MIASITIIAAHTGTGAVRRWERLRGPSTVEILTRSMGCSCNTRMKVWPPTSTPLDPPSSRYGGPADPPRAGSSLQSLQTLINQTLPSLPITPADWSPASLTPTDGSFEADLDRYSRVCPPGFASLSHDSKVLPWSRAGASHK